MSVFLFDKKIVVCLATFIIAFASYSQSTDVVFRQGLDLESKFQDQAALNKFESVLRQDPNHASALIHASRMLSNIAGRESDHDNKKHLATRARSLALQAIAIEHNNKEAHVNYVISLALLAEVEPAAKQRIQYARTIKSEADLLLAIDPAYTPALYILGKWHLTLSTLSSLEKVGCSLLFNDVTRHASLNNALTCFDKAILLEPEYILFHYNRALAQYYSGNMNESRRSINRALTLAHKEPDDMIRVNKCRDLLNKINNEE